MDQKKHIAILGSTGSIGTQALEVIEAHRDNFIIDVLTANQNANLLIEQAIRFKPQVVVIGNEELYPKVNEVLQLRNIKVMAGQKALSEVVKLDSIDLVLTALVGFSGLNPTISAVKASKNIALANKETLVVAGELVTNIALKNGLKIYPIDSEHSAIYQCLMGESNDSVERIILTASGGPFRGKDVSYLQNVRKEQALKHPNWDMGAKVTIDSATLMNKGLEVIEAKWLFGLSVEEIEVIVHPQSIIHSMVEFIDGSIKAQLGLPDMRLPIQFALGFPERLSSDFPRFNFIDYPSLTFEKPDLKTFRNLAFAYEALRKGGNMPCILNAANEIAVAKFLQEEIGFLQISDVIETCMAKIPFVSIPDLEDYINTDKETRVKALEYIN